ncbi:spore coat associated protein CotJA [Cytobacillus sp. Hm23]
MVTFRKSYHPYISPHDPCNPIYEKYFVTPPNLYITFQPNRLPQYTAKEALRKGTLWPIFYDPYYGPNEVEERGESQ